MLGFYTIEDVGCSYGLSISAKNKLDIVFLLGYPKLNKFVSLIYVSGKKDKKFKKLLQKIEECEPSHYVELVDIKTACHKENVLHSLPIYEFM